MLPLQLPQHAHLCADTHTHTHTMSRTYPGMDKYHTYPAWWLCRPSATSSFHGHNPLETAARPKEVPAECSPKVLGSPQPIENRGPGHQGFDLLTQVGCAFMVLAREASFSCIRDECSGLLSPSAPLHISTHNDERFFQGCLWDGSGETEPSGVSSMDDKSTAHSVSREILSDAAWKYPSVMLTVRDRLYADMLNQGRRGPSEATLTFPISVTLQAQQIMRLKCLYWKVLTF